MAATNPNLKEAEPDPMLVCIFNVVFFIFISLLYISVYVQMKSTSMYQVEYESAIFF